MKKSKRILTLFALILCLNACTKNETPSTGETPTPTNPSVTEPLETPTTTSPADLSEAPPREYPEYPGIDYRGEFQQPYLPLMNFTAKTGAQILTGKENATYSPMSYYLALSMLSELDPSDREILDALGVQDVEKLRSYSDYLLKVQCFNGDRGAFLPANSMWVMKGRELIPSLVKQLRSSYDADLFSVDFPNVEETKKQLTEWIKKKTFELIPNADVDLDAQTRAILLNAIYFKQRFFDPFRELPKEEFSEPNFTDSDGKKHTVAMLSSEGTPVYYFRTDDAEIAVKEMPAGMKTIFVKPTGNLSDLLSEEKLQPLLRTIQEKGENLQTVQEDVKQQFANIQVPKIHIKSKFELIPAAQALGIRKAFSPSESKLRAYSDTEDTLFISFIQQEAVFKMDKDGVEAAAYTEIGMKDSAMFVDETVDLKFDKPFFYMVATNIQDPIFIGTYCTPDGQE